MMRDKVFIFSKEEFLILAAASGIEQMYGFSIGEEPQNQEAVLCLQKLIEKEMLISVDGSFQVLEPIQSVFQQIKEVKTVIDVHKRSGRKCIIYIGDFGVKVAVSQRRQGMFEVQKIPLGNIWNHLTEEGWIPEEKGALK